MDQVSSEPCAHASATPADMKGSGAGNPFFIPYNTLFNIPPFNRIKSWHYIPAFKEGIKRQKKELEAIVNNPEPPDFENTVEALEYSGALLKEVKLVFDLLLAAHSNERMQKIAQEASILLSTQQDDLLLNEKLFERIKKVYERRRAFHLTEEQTMLLEDYYKEFFRGGADLSGAKQRRLRKINEELSRLSVDYESNIVTETNRFKLVIKNPDDLDGLPKTVRHAAVETAEKLNLKGKWVFTLHHPSMIPFLQYSEKRHLRKRIFQAYINRCNNGNENDNNDILLKIIGLRAEKANILDYANHAEYLLERNMAWDAKTVYNLLDRLWKPSLKLAKKEARTLQAVIDLAGGDFKLHPWDWWYYTEKLKKLRYNLNDHTLRRYFQLEHVRDGVFYVAQQLYGLQFVERWDIPKFHKDVQVFEVLEANGQHLGILFFDFFARAGKQHGAWMDSLRKQSYLNGLRVHPVVSNSMNFPRPTKLKPSLLNMEEVKTLFHEFGHALHGLLSNCRYERLSGTAVPPDFVELPSQIMENWAIEPEVLKVYARHYKTGEVIPQKLIDKIAEIRHFNLGFASVEYLAASYLDMDWHTVEEPVTMPVKKFEAACLNRIGLIPQIVVRYRSTNFGHIFGGGYAAGYYSYIWAEVLDADAFEAFKEKGLFHPEVARAFRTHILEKGGSMDPMTLYVSFRGREPDILPLLVRNGLPLTQKNLRKITPKN